MVTARKLNPMAGRPARSAKALQQRKPDRNDLTTRPCSCRSGYHRATICIARLMWDRLMRGIEARRSAWAWI